MATTTHAADFLRSFQCGSSLFPNCTGTIVTVGMHSTISDAMKKLIDNRILSVPVVDEETGIAVTILSMLDLVVHSLNAFNEKQLKRSTKHTFDFVALQIAQKETAENKVTSIREIGSLEPVAFLKSEHTLLDAVREMVSTGCHRVLIYNKDQGDLANVITQSRVVQAFASILDYIPQASRSVQDLQIGMQRKVLTVPEVELAYEAFKTMAVERVSGLGVVDSQGRLVGNISISDLKLLGYDLSWFSLLSLNVGQYLRELKRRADKVPVRSENLLQAQSTGDVPVVISVSPADTLAHVIKVVNYFKVHRVFVCDEEQRPVGVISLHDILLAVMGSSF